VAEHGLALRLDCFAEHNPGADSLTGFALWLAQKPF
jgi:hypothetical protein